MPCTGGLAPFAPCLCPLCGSAQAGAVPASSSPLSTSRNPLYDAYFAWNMKYGMDDYEQLVAPVKSKLFREAVQELLSEQQHGQQGGAQLLEESQQGPGYGPQRGEDGAVVTAGAAGAGAGARATRHVSILEVGVGTGPNFSFYAAAAREAAGRPADTVQQGVQEQQQQHGQGVQVRLVGVDPNPEMLKYAREAAANTQLPPGWEVELLQGSAEELPFGDGSVDAVVVTLVGTCTGVWTSGQQCDPRSTSGLVLSCGRWAGCYLAHRHAVPRPRPYCREHGLGAFSLGRVPCTGCARARGVGQDGPPGMSGAHVEGWCTEDA